MYNDVAYTHVYVVVWCGVDNCTHVVLVIVDVV